MVRVNPFLIDKLKSYGAFDITACYNCGNCTAICPLSPVDGEGYEFPRIIIRYAILGLEDKLVSAPQLWQCYYCGECTNSCPRDADPGGFMMAARRYAIAEFSWGKIGRIFQSVIGNIVALLIITFFFLYGIYIYHGPMTLLNVSDIHSAILSFIPKELIHTAGLYLGLFVLISAILNLSIMYSSVKSNLRKSESILGFSQRLWIWIKSLVKTFINETLLQLRYLKCENRNRYYAHLSIFWGFVLDFLSTGLVYSIDLGIVVVSIAFMRFIARIIGIIGGLLILYGSIYFIWKRVAKNEEFAEYSHISDWIFIGLVFLTGLSGLLLTSLMYAYDFVAFKSASMVYWAYVLFAFHLTVVFDLIVIAPFSKFSHAGYRPFVLWIVDATNEIQKRVIELKMQEQLVKH